MGDQAVHTRDGQELAWPGHTGNWQRWDNDLGTLNLITPAKVLEGIAAVSQGRVIACSRPITSVDPTRTQPVSRHEMTSAGTFATDPERADFEQDHEHSADTLWIRMHGLVNTHADGLCHVGHHGRGFNGVPFGELVSMSAGAARQGITDRLAVVTRAVLADIPRLRGVDYLEPGDGVHEAELRAAAPDVRAGDALVVRTGGTLTAGAGPAAGDRDFHGRWPGLHEDCMNYVRERDVAVLATDAPGDVFPGTSTATTSPIHVIGLTYLGIHLVHNLDLEELAQAYQDQPGKAFLFIVSSLNVPGGTGSPVTPVAILLASAPDRGSFFHERGGSLDRVLAFVHRPPQLLHLTGQVLGGVLGDLAHHGLGRAHGERCVGGDDACHRLGACAQLAGRHHLVDQADVIGPLRGDGRAGEQQLHGDPRRHLQHQRRGPRSRPAHLGLRDTKQRAVRGQAQVAALREQESGAHGDAVDGGYGRLAHLYIAAELGHVVSWRDAGARGRQLGQVPAGAERAITGTGHHQHLGRVVGVEGGHRGEHGLADLFGERVALVRDVDGQPGDTAVGQLVGQC